MSEPRSDNCSFKIGGRNYLIGPKRNRSARLVIQLKAIQPDVVRVAQRREHRQRHAQPHGELGRVRILPQQQHLAPGRREPPGAPALARYEARPRARSGAAGGEEGKGLGEVEEGVAGCAAEGEAPWGGGWDTVDLVQEMVQEMVQAMAQEMVQEMVQEVAQEMVQEMVRGCGVGRGLSWA